MEKTEIESLKSDFVEQYKNYSSKALFSELWKAIKMIRKLENQIANDYCTCGPDSTGTTNWDCCNICGKIVESEMKPKN